MLTPRRADKSVLGATLSLGARQGQTRSLSGFSCRRELLAARVASVVVTEANVATLRRGYDALNRGDVSEVLALIDDEIAWDPGELTPDSASATGGRAGFESLIRSWVEAFDDFRIEPVDVIDQPPFLLAIVRQSGRGRASGLDITIEIAHVWTVEDGRAVGFHSYRSADEALQAIA
ncbi:MAG: nuclear transport factor 2 family protein [Thermoleophilaceae bacterium]